MEHIVEVYAKYTGAGAIIGLYLASLVYLIIKEKDKNNRIFFVYMPIAMLFIFFNPVWRHIVDLTVGEEIYYRFLWLVPISFTIGYVAVCIAKTQVGKQKIIAIIGASLIIILSGSFIYKNPLYTFIENEYHMPQSVVDICDYIHVEGREVKALVPNEFIMYVRQYDSTIFMIYGREILMYGWGSTEHYELYSLMNQETYDLAQIAPLAKVQDCHYLILEAEKELIGDIEDYEYQFLTSLHGYDIYLDTTIYIGL